MTPPEVTSTQPTAVAPQRFVFDRHELAGAVADLGVLVPIAVALVVRNGLSPTAVLLPAGLLYVATAFRYRLPVPVQPLKAFGAIAVAQGLGVDVIAAGALLMGVLFLALGATGLIDRVAAWFPLAVIRGVQISVGLLFLKIAWGLVVDPPSTFLDADRPTALAGRRDGAGPARAVARTAPRRRAAARRGRRRRHGAHGAGLGGPRAVGDHVPDADVGRLRHRRGRARPPAGRPVLRQLLPRHRRCGA